MACSGTCLKWFAVPFPTVLLSTAGYSVVQRDPSNPSAAQPITDGRFDWLITLQIGFNVYSRLVAALARQFSEHKCTPQGCGCYPVGPAEVTDYNEHYVFRETITLGPTFQLEMNVNAVISGQIIRQWGICRPEATDLLRTVFGE